jgi:chemotaxis protein MotB
MSSMDDRSFRSMFTNFTSACGILYFKEYGEIYRPKDVLIEGLYERLKDVLVVKRSDDPMEEFVSETEERIFQKIGGLELQEIKNGFKLVFGHQLLFSPGSAEIKRKMKPVLEKIAKFMRNSSYQIYFDGHTDNIPIHNDEFPSNDALSLARAFNLMNYFVKEEGIPQASMALVGYGALHPLVSNDTPDGRARNRRVEIIFKSQKYF